MGIDARTEPIDLAKSLKYPPDLTLLTTEIQVEDALNAIRQLDPEKSFEGLDSKIRDGLYTSLPLNRYACS